MDEESPPASTPKEGSAGRKKTLVLVLIAVLVLAAVGGTVYFLTRPPPTTNPPPPTHTAPTAAFSAGAQTVNGPTQIQVWVNAAASTGGDGHITSYAWTWGDGGSGTGGPAVAHNYSRSRNGQSVTVSLNVTSNYSLSNTVSHSVTISVTYTPPTASFTDTVNVAARQVSVDASASSSPLGFSLTNYVWNWGDGSAVSNVTTATTTHTYASYGTRTVNLTVIDAAGLKGYVQHSVALVASPPIASFTDTVYAANRTIKVDASASSSPSGLTLLYYVWDWGDSSTPTNSSSAVRYHTYAAFGTYTVNLTVIDSASLKGYSEKSVPVAPAPPVAVFSFNVYPTNRTVLVNASGSYSPVSLPITHYVWNWGDGSPADNLTTPYTTHVYTNFATYTVNLTVLDSLNEKGYAEQSVVLSPQPPVAIFTYTVYPSNRTVFVDASASYSPVGLALTHFVWDWGDGSAVTNLTTPTTSHQFALPGSYNVNLTVLDSLNEKGYAQQSVSTQAAAPIASFTYVVNAAAKSVAVNASASYSPIGLAITHYVWDWGDGSAVTNVSTPLASHTYAAFGSYAVNLTVIDAASQKGYTEQTISVSGSPVASFVVQRTKLEVKVDGSASFSPVGNAITNYAWNWGDGSPVDNMATPIAFHNYTAAGLYTITLTVTDSASQTGTTTRMASVAASTLDYTYTDFFTIPYGEWWDIRTNAYANDFPIGANCFNATSIADGLCVGTKYPNVPAVESAPYTDWYNISASSAVYAPYRVRAVGASVPGYNLSEPVFLPVFNYNAPRGNLLTFSWTMQYLDFANYTALRTAGCIPPADKNDGYMLYSRVYLTLDAQESSRIFGAPTGSQSTIQNWWNTNTNAACKTTGTLEGAVGTWITNEANGKYDIYNAYAAAYIQINTNMTAIVAPDGTTHVYMSMIAWGTEVMLSRWFYWGNASYVAGQLDSTIARGWWGMENGWWEDLHFTGDLDAAAMNFSFSGVPTYHFLEASSPGPDGTYHSATNNDTDDVPYWIWEPILMDYNTPSRQHPNNELNRYAGLNYVHTTPGAANYGTNTSFDVTPISWWAKAGEVWHFLFPAVMPFVDPNRSPLGGNPSTQLVMWANQPTVAYDEWKTVGANYGTWNETLWTWDVYGGVVETWPDGSPGNYPYISYGSIYFVPLGSSPAAAVNVHGPASATSPSLLTAPAMPLGSVPTAALVEARTGTRSRA